MGYVVSSPRGRESLHELAEPLVRLSMQVKGTSQVEPLGVIVDFLRVWYEPGELAGRLATSDPTERIHTYVRAALALVKSGEPNLRHEILRAQFEDLDLEHCDADVVDELRALAGETKSAADWLRYGLVCGSRKENEAAAEALTNAMKVAAPESKEYGAALYCRYLAFESLGQAEKAMADCSEFIALPQASAAYRARALFSRGVELTRQGKKDEAIRDFSTAIGLPAAPADVLVSALLKRGQLHVQLGHPDEAIADSSRIVDLTDLAPGIVIVALAVRAAALLQGRRFEDALSDYGRAIDLPGALPCSVVAMREMRTDILFLLDRWSEGMKELSLVLAAGDTESTTNAADSLVAAIDVHSSSAQAVHPRAKDAVEVFAGQHALQHLGFALVRHLSQAANSSTSAESRRQWLSLWESAAGQHEAMHLPLRLLRVGIDYLASHPRGKLLDLPAEERELLAQVLPPA